MNRIFTLAACVCAACVLFSSCKNEEYADVDIPMGTTNITVRVESVSVGQTPTLISASKDIKFTDDDVFPRLRYYKNEKDIELTASNFRFRVDKPAASSVTGRIRDITIIASVDGEEIGRFERANLLEFGTVVQGSDDYKAFMSAFLENLMARKVITLTCQGALPGYTYNGPNGDGVNTGFLNFVFIQEASASIRLKRN